MKSALFFSFFICALLIAGCQREIEELANQDTQKPLSDSCHLTRTDYYDSGALLDSVNYYYSGMYISKIVYSEGYILFSYVGNKIVKREIIDTSGGTTVSSEDIYSYNASNQITLIKHYETTSIGARIFYDSTLLTYSNNKLIQIQKYRRTLSNPVFDLNLDAAFSYTGNNVSKTIVTALGSTTATTYVYDNKPNYFQKVFTQPLIIEPWFIDTPIYIRWAINMSENNVLKIENGPSPTPNMDFEYISDTKGRLSKYKSSSNSVLDYKYGCQ